MDGVESKNFLKNEDLLGLLPTLEFLSPALITPLLANTFPNRLSSNVPNSILRNPPFCS